MEYLCSCLLAQSCLILSDPMDCSHQAPLSMGFFRHEYWSGLPFPLPGDLPDPGIKPMSPALQADSLSTESPGMPKLHEYHYQIKVMVNFLRLYVCGYNTLNKNGMKYTKVYQYCHCPVMVRLYAIETSNFSNQMNFH